jgi:hypothetical protein
MEHKTDGGTPSVARGTRALPNSNGIVPAQSVSDQVAATILVASDGGILPPVLQPACGWKPAAPFSDRL